MGSAANSTLTSQLRQFGRLTPDEAGPGLLGYLATLETKPDAREVLDPEHMLAVLLGNVSVCPVGPPSRAAAKWSHLPCPAAVHVRATEHASWVELRTCTARIAAAGARGRATVRSNALDILNAFARACHDCKAPNVRPLLPQLTAAADTALKAPTGSRPALTNDWVESFASLVLRLMDATERCVLCPDAALQNALLGLLEQLVSSTAFTRGDTEAMNVSECAATLSSQCRVCFVLATHQLTSKQILLLRIIKLPSPSTNPVLQQARTRLES